MADVVLWNLLVVHQLNVGRNVELDRDGSILDLIRVSDMDVAAVEGVVKADVGAPVGKRESDLTGPGALERNAHDGMVLHHAADFMLDSEEAYNAEDEEDGHEPFRSALEATLPLPLALSSTGSTAVAEPTPEALAPTDGKLPNILVEVVDWKARINWLLDVDRKLRHERCNCRHWI